MLTTPTHKTPNMEVQYLECIDCLYSVVKDVMPQIGNIILQDYEKLNRGLILVNKILEK